MPLQSLADSLRTAGEATAYDSVWAHTDVPVQSAFGIEAALLSNDKLYVVLVVVLIIWAGLAFFLFRTDRKLDGLERSMNTGILPDDQTR